MENRPELRQAAIDLENRDIDVAYLKNQKLPILDVTRDVHTERYRRHAHDPQRQFGGRGHQVIPGGIDDAFGQLFGFDYQGIRSAFSLTIPLKQQGSQGGLRASGQ